MRQQHLAAALTFIIIMLFTIPGFAETETDAVSNENGTKIIPPVTVMIPVKHEIKGIRSSSDKKYTFILTAEDTSSPMPDHSSAGCKRVDVTDEKDINFGTITFHYPGTYYYEVSQEDSDTSYRVMIAAFNDGTSEIVIWDEADGSKTDRAAFVNEYRSSPKTGDPNVTSMILYAAAGISSLICMLLMLLRRRKEHEI